MNLDSYYDQIIKDLGMKKASSQFGFQRETELIQLFESLSESELKSNSTNLRRFFVLSVTFLLQALSFRRGLIVYWSIKASQKLIPQVFQGIDHHFLGFRQISERD